MDYIYLPNKPLIFLMGFLLAFPVPSMPCTPSHTSSTSWDSPKHKTGTVDAQLNIDNQMDTI